MAFIFFDGNIQASPNPLFNSLREETSMVLVIARPAIYWTDSTST